MLDTEKYLSTFFKGTKNPSLEAMEFFKDYLSKTNFSKKHSNSSWVKDIVSKSTKD